MKIVLDGGEIHGDLIDRVATMSGQNLYSCYQCGNCTAGCPAAFAMDAGPHQVIRYLVLGMERDVAALRSPWICAACLRCTSRCPKGIDIARVMEACRLLDLRRSERPDRLIAAEAVLGDLEGVPQMALIGGFRKFLS